MDKPWKNYLPALCGAIGTVLLAGTAWACLSLERGGPPDRIAVAAALLLLAVLALALLRWEGCGRDTLLILLLPVGAAMLLRTLSLDYAGTDYKNFLTHWYAYFQEHGGFQAVSHAVGDYNVPYLYFMAFISYLSAPDLYLIKLFSIIFDVILAWGCYRLVRSLTRERQGSAAPLIAFAAALLLPTVVLNGAYWGQCDVIYGALCIHAAALVLEGLDAGRLLRRTDGIIGREIRGKGAGGPDRLRFLGSLTCRGPVWRFDTAAALCPRIYQLQDTYGLAAPMLERLHAAARSRGYAAVVCPDPEHMDRVQHLLLPELELAFVTSREGMAFDGPAYRRVRLDAMVSQAHLKRCKARLRFTRRVADALREEGLEALREAKAAHDALEAVYRPHVDFAGVDEVVSQELERMERYL